MCALTLLLAVWQAVGVAPTNPPGTPAGKDVVLYQAIRDRLAQGEPYYPVVAEELQANGFPTWPVFHWRTPLVPLLNARAPAPAALYFALCGAVVLSAWGRDRWALAAAAAMGAGPALLSSPSGLLFAETWCGAALALSAAGYLFDRPALRVGGGLLALCLRELAGLWCVVATIEAAWAGRRREAAAWAVGGAVYLALFAAHTAQVVPLVPADPVVVGWTSFGGPLHALRCMRWFFPVLLAPGLAPFLAGATALAVLTPPREAPGVRVVAAGALLYLAAFAALGRPSNDYWGCLLAGIWGATAPLGVWGAAQQRAISHQPSAVSSAGPPD